MVLRGLAADSPAEGLPGVHDKAQRPDSDELPEWACSEEQGDGEAQCKVGEGSFWVRQVFLAELIGERMVELTP